MKSAASQYQLLLHKNTNCGKDNLNFDCWKTCQGFLEEKKMFLSFLYIFFYIFSTKTNTSRFLHFTPHILLATSPLSLLVIFPWQENNYSSRLQKWNKLSILILLLPCSLVNLMMTDKLYMLLVASSLDGSTSAIMASWNRKGLLWRISAKSFLSFLRISLSVALLGNSIKPILVKGFPVSPSFTVLRMLTGSLTVYDSSVKKEKIWILAKRGNKAGHFRMYQAGVQKKNSKNFATAPCSPAKWTTAEIPHWWRVTTQIRVV